MSGKSEGDRLGVFLCNLALCLFVAAAGVGIMRAPGRVSLIGAAAILVVLAWCVWEMVAARVK